MELYLTGQPRMPLCHYKATGVSLGRRGTGPEAELPPDRGGLITFPADITAQLSQHPPGESTPLNTDEETSKVVGFISKKNKKRQSVSS